MRSFSFTNPTAHALAAAVDGEGILALQWQRDATPQNTAVDFTAPEGTFLAYDIGENLRDIQPLGRGFAGTGYIDGSQGEYTVRFLYGNHVMFDVEVHRAWGFPFVATDPSNSGFVVAGTFRDNYPSRAQTEARWMAQGTLPSPLASAPLASTEPIMVAGMDRDGNMLVIFNGHVAGQLEAQWFSPGAGPLTGLFAWMTGFVPGPDTWLEMTSALGGGILITRFDAGNLGRDVHARHLCQIATGGTTCQALPQWMENRPDTRLRVVRGGRAWAAFTTQGEGVDCSDTIEIVAPDGTSCGSTELRMAPGTCDRLGLTIGPEGTVVQTLPRGVRMPDGDDVGWRWWPRMLH